MLPAHFRLRRTADITNVVRRGRVFQAGPVRVHYLVNPNRSGPRIACVVGKKVSAEAVVRHRYQRWLRVLAAEFVSHRAGSAAYDMVWVGLPSLHQHASLTDLKTTVWPQLTTLPGTDTK